MGVRAGLGNPSPLGGRFGCEFSISDGFGGKGGDIYAKTRPRPAPLLCLVGRNIAYYMQGSEFELNFFHILKCYAT